MDGDDEDELSSLELIVPPVTAIVGLPIHQGQVLEWGHEVALIGNKCPNPRIHVCESCDSPILVYGRLVSVIFCSCSRPNRPILSNFLILPTAFRFLVSMYSVSCVPKTVEHPAPSVAKRSSELNKLVWAQYSSAGGLNAEELTSVNGTF